MGSIHWLAVFLSLAAPVDPRSDLSQGLGKPVAPTAASRIDAAIEKLRIPCPFRAHINESGGDGLDYRSQDMYEDCSDEMDLLVKTTVPVDARLLRMAGEGDSLPARYRAVWVLIQRRNAAVVPILERMATAASAEERFLAWRAYEDGVVHGQLPVPRSFDRAIDQYRKEKNKSVRDNIAYFLGAARARPAVPVLIAALQADRYDDCAISALGEIGDPQAVPALIAAAKAGKHWADYRALGHFSTPEAVDFLIAHLGKGFATEALFLTGSPKALPALRKHLEKLKSERKTNELELATTRIAVWRLAHADPRELLLRAAENPAESEWMRVQSLEALQEYAFSPYSDRLLQLYKNEKNEHVRLQCIRLLCKEAGAGITEALIAHALKAGRDEWICDDDLLETLNHRLQTSFRDMNSLRAHLKTGRSAQER
jgi:HEAT repeat protein